MAFLARIETLEPLPDSEMAETALFESLPEHLTYPDITPILFKHCMEGEQGVLAK